MKYKKEDLDALPKATCLCGIIQGDPRLTSWFNRLAHEEAIAEQFPPVEDGDQSEHSVDEDG